MKGQNNVDTNKTTMHNNTPIVPYVSLCSGYEGIGLGLHRCIPNLRCIAYCEREAFVIANLVAKMENGLLDAAPVFTDVTTFPWEQFAPYMAGGILSFGWPCQPVSCAGKRKATEDERWLFDIIADGIAIMRPGILFAENVEGLLSAKMPNGSLVFAHCIERLESLHYKVAAEIFSASEVGAPHQRKRVFILAYRKGERLPQFANIRAVGREVCATSLCGQLANGNEQRLERGIQPGVSPKEKQNEFVAGYGCALANANGAGGWEDRQSSESWAACLEQSPSDSRGSESREIREGQAWPSRPGEQQFAWEPPRIIPNSISNRLHNSTDEQIMEGEGGGKLQVEQSRDSTAMGNSLLHGHAAGEITGGSGAGETEGRLQEPAGGSGAMGNPDSPRPQKRQGQQRPGIQGTDTDGGADAGGQAQPAMGGDADGPAGGLGYAELCVSCDNRTDELRLLGNGVVPATAARAFVTLLQELTK